MIGTRRRRVRDEQEAAVYAAPRAPQTPTELGLMLRSARERAGLRLEDVRDRIEVPKIDLIALEDGQLELLHTERAAVVALQRYAALLGLDGDVLVRVISDNWPEGAIGMLSVWSSVPGRLPVARIAAATTMLEPISKSNRLAPRSRALGLSAMTRSALADSSARQSLESEILAPARVPRSRRGSRPSVASTAGTSSAAISSRAGAGNDEGTPSASPGGSSAVLERAALSGPELISSPRGPAPTKVEAPIAPDLIESAEGATEIDPAAPAVASAQPTVAEAADEKPRRARAPRTRRARATSAQKAAEPSPEEQERALEAKLLAMDPETHEALLREALGGLAKDESDVLSLVMWEGLSNPEAAIRLGLSPDEFTEVLDRSRFALSQRLIELTADS